MGSSLGFGSSACDYGSCDPRPIQTRFRFGSSRQALTSPHTANSPDHSSIGTPSRYRDESRQHASTACRHTVSVSISLPSRGAFHLSLTVLVRYRWRRVFSLGGWSPRIPTSFLVARGTRVSLQRQEQRRTGLSPSLVGRSRPFLKPFLTAAGSDPTTPASMPAGLGCCPFARRY